MWFKTFFILLLVSILTTGFAFGQNKPDTTETKKLYDNIESYSGKSKFTKFFYRLVEPGKLKFRQFIKPQVIIGINRFNYDSLTLNEGYGIEGFKSTALSGKSRMLFTIQTQSYSPWNFIGFRFGPFLNCTVGMLSGETGGYKNSQVYAQIGVGILIKNDYLVFNIFQISVSFYPMIPGGRSAFKFNSFKTADFGFGNFEIGEPDVVPYH